MRYFSFLFLAIVCLSCLSTASSTQKPLKVIEGGPNDPSQTIVPYELFERDSLGIRKYVLKNGLTILTAVNKEEPRLQTLITTKGGSVNDPRDHTGLAHYLEHLLFKGTTKIGTVNYEKEKVEIEKIKDLYEAYGATKDSLQRDSIYHLIDSVSTVASQYVATSEWDALQSVIGASRINAYTSKENTTYVCEIPSNQLENWINLEAERFRAPVMRLFHTELETVYEEKNRTLDNHNRRLIVRMYQELFEQHNYGQQTGIGTIEHLKSPSIRAIDKFYKEQYVPNNMCIVMAGDFDPDSAVKHINASFFGKWESGVVPKYVGPIEREFKEPKRVSIEAPDAEALIISFRTPGYNAPGTPVVKVIDMLLSNSSAGLIDINISKPQKAAYATSTQSIFKDYGMQSFYGMPTQGQSLEDLEKLLLAQLDSIKAGSFPDWLLEAVKLDFKISNLKKLQSNKSIAYTLNDAFVLEQPVQKRIDELNELQKVTKQQVINYAKKHYNKNYVVIYKKQVKDYSSGVHVTKPKITPLKPNENNHSEFAKDFEKKSKVPSIKPVFVDYRNHVDSINFNSGNTLIYQHNKHDALFSLSFEIPFGVYQDKRSGIAASLMNVAGSAGLSAAEIEQEFYKIGATYGVHGSDKKTTIYLSGLNEKFDETLNLMAKVVKGYTPTEQQLSALKANILKDRENQLNDKRSLFGGGLFKYLIFGKKNKNTDRLSNKELKALTAKELKQLFTQTMSLQQTAKYYGPKSMQEIGKIISEHIFTAEKYEKATAPKKFVRDPMHGGTKIFALDFEMQQAEVYLLSRDTTFSKKNLTMMQLFNEYYGRGMASVIFKELREKKALAYSAYAMYSKPYDTITPLYTIAYIGTQADKTPEAIQGMFDLLNKMPLDSLAFEKAKQNFKQNIETKRLTRSNITRQYIADKKIGYAIDKRKVYYEEIDKITLQDVNEFFKQSIANKNFNIGIIGNLKKIDLKALEKFGKVQIIQKEELFKN